VSAAFDNRGPGPLLARDRALVLADRGVLVVAAKPADDGEGAIVKLLDVTGAARPVALWPAAYAFQLARRTNLVEMNDQSLPVGPDQRASVDLASWGVAAVRLWTPRERGG
jgi:alpha-mannosidase